MEKLCGSSLNHVLLLLEYSFQRIRILRERDRRLLKQIFLYALKKQLGCRNFLLGLAFLTLSGCGGRLFRMQIVAFVALHARSTQEEGACLLLSLGGWMVERTELVRAMWEKATQL